MGRRGYPGEFRQRVLDLVATARRVSDIARLTAAAFVLIAAGTYVYMMQAAGAQFLEDHAFAAGTAVSTVFVPDSAVASSLEWLIGVTVAGLLGELCATALVVVALVRHPVPAVSARQRR